MGEKMVDQTKIPHVSVMLPEVLEYLSPKKKGVYVDGTFGAGGYSKSILDEVDCTIIAIDLDPEVKEYAQQITDRIKNQPAKQFHFVQGNFGDIEEIVKSLGYQNVDGIVLDLGVSSMQLDRGDRGFSFNQESMLDMRMSKEGVSAYEVINTYPELELADIIYKYGDEKKSRQIAKKIVQQREIKPISTTIELANIIRSIVGKKGIIDPATKTFQAIRIFVNDELQNLRKVLEASEKLLNDQGKLVIVSFHSLEDKIVKNYLSNKSGKIEGVSRYLPTNAIVTPKSFELLTKKAIMCSEQEKNHNIRARSARLRAGKRLRREDV